MARCGRQCPYHWHDDECEYCSARGDEVIDLRDYSYDTCPYYLEYKGSERSEPSDRDRANSAEPEASGGGGAGILLLIVIAAILIFCVRSCGSALLSSPSARQTEPPAGETPAPIETDPPRQDSGFIFPNSDTEPIGPGEAEALSDSELTYAINEIYARHGYIFKSAELSEYYGQFSWYVGEVPSSEFSVECFSQTEQQNLNLLVSERNSRKASG